VLITSYCVVSAVRSMSQYLKFFFLLTVFFLYGCYFLWSLLEYVVRSRYSSLPPSAPSSLRVRTVYYTVLRSIATPDRAARIAVNSQWRYIEVFTSSDCRVVPSADCAVKETEPSVCAVRHWPISRDRLLHYTCFFFGSRCLHFC
jgi:hypothetical protein